MTTIRAYPYAKAVATSAAYTIEPHALSGASLIRNQLEASNDNDATVTQTVATANDHAATCCGLYCEHSHSEYVMKTPNSIVLRITSKLPSMPLLSLRPVNSESVRTWNGYQASARSHSRTQTPGRSGS